MRSYCAEIYGLSGQRPQIWCSSVRRGKWLSRKEVYGGRAELSRDVGPNACKNSI